MSSGDEIRAERIKKLALLKDAGMEAYPAQTKRDSSVANFLSQFDALEKNGGTKTVVGRVMSLRGQGGIVFADVFDGTAKMQLVCQKEGADETMFGFFEKAVDIGDFIEVTGVAYKTKRGVLSMQVRSWRMLSKSLQPIPSEWFGIKDEETRLRQRYLDILLNQETRAMFERRAKFWQAIRNFLLARGFMEVETPVLESSPGGADARPFITHHNALDIDVYLRISAGELWQKRLLVAGFPKVFEIGRIFRNEGQSREHLQDYTQLETYEAFSDIEKGKEFIQDLYRQIVKEVYGEYTFAIGDFAVDFAEEWATVDFCEEIQKRFGVDPISCSEDDAIQAVRDAEIKVGEELNKARAIDHLWKAIRKTIGGPAFLVNIPAYLEPLAKRSSANPDVVERVQILIAGSEVGKGFSELNDPLDQRARFEEQQAMRDAGDDEAQRLDEEYVQAMEYGMPPAFGFGVSERLFAFLENRPAHEAQIFPLLRPKSESGPSKSKETMVAAIILNNEALDAPWKELNTTAHLAASFAAREGKKLFMQDSVVTKDGLLLALNIQHAIMIREAAAKDIAAVLKEAKSNGMTSVPFTKEMLETTDDSKVAKLTAALHAAEVKYLGILVFGKRRDVEHLTQKYPLHE